MVCSSSSIGQATIVTVCCLHSNTRYAYSNCRIIKSALDYCNWSVDFDKITDVEDDGKRRGAPRNVGTIQFFPAAIESNDDTVAAIYDKWHAVVVPRYELFRNVKQVILDKTGLP
jgi:hypothetical protein